MKNILISLILVFFTLSSALAQREKSEIRDGNRHFKAEKFEDSEIAYRKALDLQSNSLPANFNLGDALYKQEKFEEAGKLFSDVSIKNTSKEVVASAFHNMGNALLQAGKLDESIEAYKDALRRNPGDMETKYNLAYAQNLKKQQEEQEQKQDKDDQQDQKDQKDQKDQQQDKKEDQKQDQKQDQQDQQQKDQQDQQDQQQEQQEQQQKPNISKEDAQRLLDALANDEQKTQEKVKLAKAKAKRVRTLKDW